MREQTFDVRHKAIPTRLTNVLVILSVLGCVGFFFCDMSGPYWLMFAVEWSWVGYSIISFFQSKRYWNAELARREWELELALEDLEVQMRLLPREVFYDPVWESNTMFRLRPRDTGEGSEDDDGSPARSQDS